MHAPYYDDLAELFPQIYLVLLSCLMEWNLFCMVLRNSGIWDRIYGARFVKEIKNPYLAAIGK